MASRLISASLRNSYAQFVAMATERASKTRNAAQEIFTGAVALFKPNLGRPAVDHRHFRTTIADTSELAASNRVREWRTHAVRQA